MCMGLISENKTGTQSFEENREKITWNYQHLKNNLSKQNSGFCTGFLYCLQIKAGCVSG